MMHYDTPSHVRGASQFLDDLPEPAGCLHLGLCVSPIAHGTLNGVDVSAATAMDGVAAVLLAADIPGENEIGTIIRDEPLLADGTVHFAGQPVAVVVANSPRLARLAAEKIQLDLTPLPALLHPRDAAASGQLIAPSRTLALGDVDSAWQHCDHVISGTAFTGGQEHLYLETQCALAVPDELSAMKIVSSTQSPTAVQRVSARVLGVPMHKVQVEVKRLGGAFGGKEDQATPYAVFCALAAQHLNRPAKLVLTREEDMRLTGKRHPYDSDFKIGFNADGQILAYEAHFYQDAGASADLSTAVLERTLFHATNAYFIPHVRVTGYSCRTHKVPNTAYRGFGGPQGLFVIESAMAKVAATLGLSNEVVQRRNLLNEGDLFPYGAPAKDCHARRSFDSAATQFKFDSVKQEIADFNAKHRLKKRGAALMPICFGISFTSTFLNQAGALVHIYSDGSVSVATGAVEMGQGVNAKIRHVVAVTLGISPERIEVQATSTRTVANTSPTAASAAADLNGMAARLACQSLKARLLEAAARALKCAPEAIYIENDAIRQDGDDAGMTWEDLIAQAYVSRINLSAQAHYATPGISYDKSKEKGLPFAYHVYGTACIQATVDVLRGTASIDSVQMLHDAGRSLNPLIDQGQAEGAVMQGIGWMTMEELCYGDEGQLLTDSLTTYKIPDLHTLPPVLETRFLEDTENPHAVLQSKGIGEPPFLYGIGAFFAIQNALHAARPHKPLEFTAPLTHERILRFLLD